MSGENGNVFNLIGICMRALHNAGMDAEAEEMRARCWASHSYDKSIQIMMEYVDVE